MIMIRYSTMSDLTREYCKTVCLNVFYICLVMKKKLASRDLFDVDYGIDDFDWVPLY